MSPSSFQKRIEKLRNLLEIKKLDVFVFLKPENISYLTGFAEEGFLFIDREDISLFVNSCIFSHYKNQDKFIKIFTSNSFLESLNKISKKKKIKKIAVEENFISYEQYKMIEQSTKLKIFPQNNIVERMRMIKDEEEIKFIKKACEITDLGFNYILNFIKEGVRECEISLELEYFLKKNFNIQKLAFPVIVAGGSNSAIPHYPTGDYKIRYGDCILIDFGVIFSNYCSDLTRTVFLGKIDSEKKKIYSLVKDSQKIAIEKIREGERCKNVEKVVREYFKEKGFNKYFIHNLGHGLGRQVHEFPSISSKDKTILNSGMVFTIEPGLYFPGKYGIRIEDVVLINKKEVELITKSEKNILVI